MKTTIQDRQIQKALSQKKTNKEWYGFHNQGSYFKFENGTLLQCPMNIDGTRDDTSCEVDWERVEGKELISLKAVAQVLAANP
jgi:hypothetical protein